MSSVVKLQGHADWHVYDTSDKTYYPFSFSPLQVQGFSEYQAVYSHFKLLKVGHDDLEASRLVRTRQAG